jgi:glycosyltransferase involved in cell wall biosynthesis
LQQLAIIILGRWKRATADSTLCSSGRVYVPQEALSSILLALAASAFGRTSCKTPSSPEKGVEKAIKIARRAGIPLKIAAKVDKADLDYYNAKIKRLLKGPGVEFIGEIGDRDKGEFLGRAMALLFPIDWPEPFGLVMIEAMANGAPVVAFRRGSVPEVIDEGLTGFVVDSVDRAVAAVPRAAALDRSGIRRCFEERFSVERMARDYIEIYDDVLRRSSIDAVVLSTRAAGQREAA